MNRSALALSLTALVSTTAFALPPRGAQPMRASAPAGEATPNATVVSGCTKPGLQYGNGPLIQNVKIYDVFYSPGNQFVDMLSAFYTGITQSAYFDWLSEYNSPDGKYKIGRGSFLGKYQDTNAATTMTLNDNGTGTTVQSYLQGLITAKKVPAPDDNTLYMIYFPSSVTIKLDAQDSSCAQFCAYHSSFTVGGQKVRYGVMPDVTAGACAQGCGPNSGFLNVTDVSSHEMIEAVTDPDNGTGWYDTQDNNCGEIGDICATNQGETGTVASFTVQKEWSNAAMDCIVQSPDSFTVASDPAMVQVAAGGMATAKLTLTLAATTGKSQTAMLTAKAPSGVTATLAPTSAMSSGGTSTLTITADASAMLGAIGKVTVNAVGTSVQSSLDVPVTVVAPPDMAQPPVANNGGNGGNGGGNGGNGGTGGGNGSGGNGSGGANQLNGGSSGCSIGGAGIGGAWAVAALLLLALAFRRRRV